MRLQFINKNFGAEALLGSVAGAASMATPVGAGLAVAQGAFGIVQTISAAAKMKKLLAQRTTYKTPKEYYEILQATQNMAQQGYDPNTLNYLTNQTDRAFSSTVGAATRLGANPNNLSALFDQKMQQVMKIGAENHELNMKNLSMFLGAKDTIGQNMIAEWRSREDLIKDKMQAAGADKQAGLQNIGSAANAGISLASSSATSNLYKDMIKAAAEMNKKSPSMLDREGMYTPTNYRAGQEGGIYGAPDEYLMQFR